MVPVTGSISPAAAKAISDEFYQVCLLIHRPRDSKTRLARPHCGFRPISSRTRPSSRTSTRSVRAPALAFYVRAHVLACACARVSIVAFRRWVVVDCAALGALPCLGATLGPLTP